MSLPPTVHRFRAGGLFPVPGIFPAMLMAFLLAFGAPCQSYRLIPPFPLQAAAKKGQKSAQPASRTGTSSNARTEKPRTDLPPVELPAEAGLYAVIYTSSGNIVCRLFATEAPKTVAVFRGLATGTKTWTDPKTGRPRHTPLYDNTTFHRVIPDFMIQGGDPKGDGTGSPGFEFANEIIPDKLFDRPGLLAMANSGPDTNGCQFFITVAPAEHLNGKYSVFGEVVTGQEVADAISKVPRNGDDKPDTPVVIKGILIRTVGESKTGA